DATGDPRFEAPEIVKRNMEDGRIGLRTGRGFLDYDGMDVPAYRRQRLAALAAMLRHMKLMRPPG
ncbi:MAG: 3-hydroxyacyl-CoA dehydrogenase, partial [Pseudomonadota bacterium]